MSGRAYSEGARTTLRTAARALSFLECVALAETPPKLKDVAAELGINITTGYHLFNTLQDAGYLTRGADGTLRIGGRAGLLYRGFVRHLQFGRDIHPIVAELSAVADETAYLSSLSGKEVIVQDVVEGSQAVRVAGLHVGFSGSEHIRASGKSVLAHLDQESQRSILEPITRGMGERAAADLLTKLEHELQEVRERGWAIDDREFDAGVCCVSAPIFGPSGDVAGSLAVSVPAERFAASRDRIIPALRQAAERASRVLGYYQPTPASRA